MNLCVFFFDVLVLYLSSLQKDLSFRNYSAVAIQQCWPQVAFYLQRSFLLVNRESCALDMTSGIEILVLVVNF